MIPPKFEYIYSITYFRKSITYQHSIKTEPTIKSAYETIVFLRLIPKNDGVEIVIAVGEKELWGKGIGHKAVLEALKKAFFDMRTEKVVAKIKKTNKRSRNLFKGIGFMEVKELEREIEYKITRETFFKIAS